MGVLTAVWVDDISVIAAQVLARGAIVRGNIDLRASLGAKLFVRIGRGGTTALSSGIDVFIHELLAAGASGGHPGNVIRRKGETAAAASTTISADAAIGAGTITVASAAGFAADDQICIQDSDGGVTRLEFNRVSAVSGNVLTLTDVLGFGHTAVQADTVRDKAEVYGPIWVPGGSLVKSIIDYAAQTTGDSVVVQVKAQNYTSENLA